MQIRLAFIFICSWIQAAVYAQTSAVPDFFHSSKEIRIYHKVISALKQELDSKGVQWPIEGIYLRAFKLEKELEVWVKSSDTESFHHFKTYPVCALSGTFGPKRKEGDKQIPEGFYYINEWKPYSNYHLALGINYPNDADLLEADPQQPGGDIYIHGKCVTIGCLPITDAFIEQLYCLTAVAKQQGQERIPVHIFPYRFRNSTSAKRFHALCKNAGRFKSFHLSLQPAYDYFEKNRQLPLIQTGGKGKYVISPVTE